MLSEICFMNPASWADAAGYRQPVIFGTLVTEIHMHMFEPVMEGSGSAVAFTEPRGK